MNKKVLLVDDDLDDQLFVREAIEKIAPLMDYTVANNGKEALLHIQYTALFDIIIIDINMPLMNGFEVLKKIKAIDHYKNIPVIVLSASTDKFDLQRAKRFGAAHYIVKPHTLAELKAELKIILEYLMDSIC
jgi:CheY-like chemotaxis protein